MDCSTVSETAPTGTPAHRLETLTSWDSDWAGLAVVVTGISKTGFSVADTLAELGARVVVVAASDDAESQALADTLKIVGVKDVILGEETSTVLPLVEGEQAQLVVTSPGYAPNHPLLAAAAAANIPIWGDVELAWRVRTKSGRKTAAWITITGTNGKTTTTTMVESMLQGAGLRAIAAGNIGTPILDAVRDPEGYDALAVELSSFQLHWTESVAPVSSVCLNLAEDHVDWHGGFDAYAADKAKIYANTQIACVYNAEQIETERMVEAADVQEGCRAVGFTTSIPAISMVGVVEGLLVDRAFLAERKDSATELAKISDIGDLVPRHLVANAAAAAALVLAYGLTPADVRKGLQAYHNGDHRIQAVASAEGVLWVNDSKATNPHAAAASLAAFNPVIWIAGGLSKGVDYNGLVREHAPRLKAVVLIGEDSSALANSLARHAPNVRVIVAGGAHTETVGKAAKGDAVMAQAVAEAAVLSSPGDTVLMAPASASMDQFVSYAHRGQAFIDAVKELLESRASAKKES